MTTRKDLDKQAKNAGVEDPQELENAEQVKEEKAIAEGKARRYYFPEHGVTVVAKDREQADEKLALKLKGSGSENA